MRVLMLPGRWSDHRVGDVDGDTIRGSHGASGTDQSFIVAAEGLAAAGHDVTIACGRSAPPARVRGVLYVNEASARGARAIVMVPWVTHLPDDLEQGVTVAIWFQSILRPDERMLREALSRGADLVLVTPSHWTLRVVYHAVPFLERMRHRTLVVPNPLMADLLPDAVPPPEDRGLTAVFHATFERGGAVAQQAFSRLGFAPSDFHVMDYFQSAMTHHPAPGCTAHGSVGKRELMKVLSKCKYFVYPLAQPNGCLHLDTFAVCVAEALACGVIVVTLPAAALPELYGEHLEYADVSCVPGGAPSDPRYVGSEAIDAFAREVFVLDRLPRGELSQRAVAGAAYARSRFAPGPVCAALLDALMPTPAPTAGPSIPARRRVVLTIVRDAECMPLLAAHLRAQLPDFDEWRVCGVGRVGEEASAAAVASLGDAAKTLGVADLWAGCQDPNTSYLRLADDVVWLEPGFVGAAFRRLESEAFGARFVALGTVNTPLATYLHERVGAFRRGPGAEPLLPLGDGGVAYNSGQLAEDLHRQFLAAVAEPEGAGLGRWRLPDWKLLDGERLPPSAVAWTGAAVDADALTACERPDVIHFGGLCSRYASPPQREHLQHTDVLDRYRKLIVS